MRHLLLIAGLLLTPAWSQKTQTEAPKKSEQALEFEALLDCKTEKPTELFRVTRVVDGDTLWIDRYGKQEKLRLLSVDTEEKFVPGNQYSDTKPYTWFGNECAAWTRGFFAPRNPDQEEVLVGLSFPQNIEARDVYGRLLCHVVTEEGIDFNLLLVRRGMSPYFNKYGNSRICHERFLAAQKKARAAGLGIWNPQAHPDGNHRPYDRLLPWWNVRAQAVEDFRVKSTAEPLRFVNSEEPEALEAALKNGPSRITTLGIIDKIFDEEDGSKTVLMRSGDRKRSLRIVVAKGDWPAMEKADLLGSMEEFRQNYLLVDGTLETGPRGFYLTGTHPADWRRAGPEPAEPQATGK
ncbi:MAG: thermonuclease family protein [Planctomycetota bacterium]